MKAKFVPIKGLAMFRGGALLLAALAGGLPCAHALQSDRKQTLLVVAGDMHYDNIAQATVFTGHVTITKGSLKLHAAKVLVRQHADGYDAATAYGSVDAPATFDQTLDSAPGQPRVTIHGSALQLHYDGRSDMITLTGQALLERSLDGHLSDRAQGAVITYSDLTDVFNVHSGKAGATASNPRGRVRVLLSPRAAPTATPPAAGTPALRESATLEPRR